MPTHKPPPDAVRKEIDENIRRIYQQTLEEELPEDLRCLLARLREQEGGNGAS